MDAAQVQRLDGRLKLTGELRLDDGAELWAQLQALVKGPVPRRLEIDLTAVEHVDGAVVALLVELRDRLREQGTRVELRVDDPKVREMVHLYGGDRPPAAHFSFPPPKRSPGAAWLSRVGRTAAAPIAFLGEVVDAFVRMVRQPAQRNWRELPAQLVRAGADGVPIVLLLNFLIGFVTAFQSVNVLRAYGANTYIADLVGASVTRELAPLLTAIIVGGRSGASYAAELGAMRVSEEIDAVRTLGLVPAAYLIYPRVLALTLVAPGLALIGDVMGLLGGGVVAVTSLGLSFDGYLERLHEVVEPADIISGLIKSAGFGATVGFIGCQQGFATRGAAVGVGKSTTTTVVLCLFFIVVLDTVFTVIFRAIDL